MSNEHGRNVIVTGGSRGLGLGIGCRLAEAGFRVIAVARKPSAELAANGKSLHFWAGDLGEVEAIPGLVKAIAGEFGPIYGLVNNAGIGTSGVLANMRAADIERTVRLNTISPMMLTKHVVRTMMVAGEGGASSISPRLSARPVSAACRSMPRPRRR
jgi:3-oxoacyl-[acyl-carrier protein] reductase